VHSGAIWTLKFAPDGNTNDDDVYSIEQHMGYKNLYPFGPDKTAEVKNEIKIADI
jgi:hypothetical protein